MDKVFAEDHIPVIPVRQVPGRRIRRLITAETLSVTAVTASATLSNDWTQE